NYSMRKETKTRAVKDLATFKKLLGPPPVLSSENRKAFDTIMARFMECIEPRDFIEQMLVKDLAYHTWEIIRYSRHKTLVVEREYHRQQEIEAKREQRLREIRAAAAERAEERKAKEA